MLPKRNEIPLTTNHMLSQAIIKKDFIFFFFFFFFFPHIENIIRALDTFRFKKKKKNEGKKKNRSDIGNIKKWIKGRGVKLDTNIKWKAT